MQTGKLPFQTLSVLLLMAWSLQAQSTPAVGRTAGELAVSATGAATYSVPLTLPPGIGEVVPSLALTYNSQAGDGIAGWGWSLAGLSSIARVGATLHHDGFIDPVDLDDNDRFALDGQRLLLKEGTYGEAGSSYQTENYSNLLVVLQKTERVDGITRPETFIVYYPDGSRAWYAAAGDLETAISRWEDPQGNRIDYDYSETDGLLQISKISYGSQDKDSHPNAIEFGYVDRTVTGVIHVGERTFIQHRILYKINVLSNGNSFRQYDLVHEQTAMGYDRVQKIKESNASQSRPAVHFSYYDKKESLQVKHHPFKTTNTDQLLFDPEKEQLIAGDFNEDGKADFMTFKKKRSTNFKFHFQEVNPQQEDQKMSPVEVVNNIAWEHMVSTQVFDNQNQTLHNGFIGISETIKTYEGLHESLDYDYSEMLFRSFRYDSNAVQPLVYEDRIWNTTRVNSNESCDSETTRVIPKEVLSGDFNGDGVQDIILIEKPYTQRYYYNSLLNNCTYAERTANTRQVYFVDFSIAPDRQFVKSLKSLDSNIKSGDLFQVADFNGDGKSDLLHLTQAQVTVYGMNANDEFEQIVSQELPQLDLDKTVLLGDFNGDRKIDLMYPLKINQMDWYYCLSDGAAFQTHLIKDTGLRYREPKGEQILNSYWDADIFKNDQETFQEYRFIAQDVNNDGKTDILEHYKYIANQENSETVPIFHGLSVHQNIDQLFTAVPTNKVRSGSPHYKRYDYTYRGQLIENAAYGFPLQLNLHPHSMETRYTYVVDKKVMSFDFYFNHAESVRVASINNSGKVYKIEYEPLTAIGDKPIFFEEKNQIYPYVNINTALSLPLVSKVTQTGSGLQGTQEFKYYGAVSHLRGLGFLGFQGVARTNVYGSGVSRQWSVSRHAPDQRGAITQSWQQSQHSFTPPTADYISRTDYDYYTQSLANKVYINSPASIRTRDGLMGFETVQSFTYDAYQNPTRILTEKKRNYTIPHRKGPGEGRSEPDQPDWWQEQTLTYSHRPEARNKYYHIGRFKQEETTTSWDGNQLTTTVAYPDYANNLLEKQTTTNNTGQTLTETFEYDDYGNLIEKSLSAADLADRTESYSYTDDGRFLARHTDVSGLESHFTYHPEGSLHTETDPLGRTTTYSYDAWQRLTQSTDYLGNSSHIRYSWLNTNHMVQHREGADGSESETHYDVWGQSIETRQKDISGKWQRRTTEYRVSGAVYRQSEPFFQGSKVYTTYSYDSYGRPSLQSLPSGKQITTTYTKGTPLTSVWDGYQRITSYANALGEIQQLTDPNGTMHYRYWPDGQLLESDLDGHKVRVTYDGWGRKTQLSDPAAGDYSYTHDAYGQLTRETSPWGRTDYTYTDDGLLKQKIQKGDSTDLVTIYAYTATRQLDSYQTRDNHNGGGMDYSFSYDSYHRLTHQSESHNSLTYSQDFGYDDLGRINSEIRKVSGAGITDEITLTPQYAENGAAIGMDRDSQNLWRLVKTNARGQALQIALGNGITKTRKYHKAGAVTQILEGTALQLDYNYNHAQGVMTARRHLGFATETFTHDQRNRLTSSKVGGIVKRQSYDEMGRILKNDEIGIFHYSDTRRYRMDSLTLTGRGVNHLRQHPYRLLDYNMDRKPLRVENRGHGLAAFVYNDAGQRVVSKFTEQSEIEGAYKSYIKFYATLFPTEIRQDTNTGETRVIHFVGGDAYSAPVAIINQKEHYLHRDHLGSILAITDANKQLLEFRHFDAWGNLVKFHQNSQVGNFTDSILQRGFTGHEHFIELNLIHMNGRVYDPKLHQFLAPDNHIQDPYNSMSYDRFGYVWNNPLGATDASGEIIQFVVLGALMGAFNAAASGGNFGDILLGAVIGGIAGGLGAGIGNLAAGGGFFSQAALNVSGFASGFTAGFAGGFVSGFVGATLNSLAAGNNIGKALSSGFDAGLKAGVFSGLTAGIGAGVKARKAGGDFWNGKGATFDTLAPPGTPTEVGQDLEYSNKFARDFSNKHFGEVKGLNELYADGTFPKGYTLKNNRVLNPKGQEVLGVTKPLGGGKYNVHLAKAAFSSKEQLYLTMQHEYLHINFYLAKNFNGSQHHASIYRWQFEQSVEWGFNKGFHYFQRSLEFSGYLNPELTPLIPKILKATPW